MVGDVAMRRLGGAWLLILPAIFLYSVLLILPLTGILLESLRPHEEGRAAGLSVGWTLDNYADFAHWEYFRVFRTTIWTSLIACVAGLLLAYPVAHLMARTRSRRVRWFWINLMVSALFLDLLIRAYALALLFGPTGIMPLVSRLFGVSGNNVLLVQTEVVIGMLYFIVPICVLTLLGPIENINPNLREAARTLGAADWKSMLVTDVALSVPALLASFLMTFTLAISAFTIPLILGKGFVTFVANLVYARFSELADFPGGAALSVLFLVFSVGCVLAVSRLARPFMRPV